MKDYSKMSDQDINKEVEKATGMYCIDCEGRYIPTCDHCNDPYDAWKIIDSCDICIEFDLSEDGESRWCNASNVSKKISVKYQKNPLRAAMIVYLIMKDEQ